MEINALVSQGTENLKTLHIAFNNKSEVPIKLNGGKISWKYASPRPTSSDPEGKIEVAESGGSVNLNADDIDLPVQPGEIMVFSLHESMASLLLKAASDDVKTDDLQVILYSEIDLAWVETGESIKNAVREVASQYSGSDETRKLHPVVLWQIPCFDRRKDEPLPPYHRSFLLDWNKLDEEQVSKVQSILAKENGNSPKPQGFETAIISIEHAKHRPDNRMLEFRDYFWEASEEEVKSRFDEATRDHIPVAFVNLQREYFEDENGKEVTTYEMIQHVSGQEQPVILGDAGSIMRLGPSDPKADAEWTEKSANSIAQFLEVVDHILRSEWYNHEQCVTFEVSKELSKEPLAEVPGSSDLLEAVFPNQEETMSILAYFRQLHAGDKLLIRACDTYAKTCSDERKTWWVEERKQSFIQVVDSPPRIFKTSETRRTILRMFMYGAGLLHAGSHSGDDERLQHLVAENGKEVSVVIFNTCLYDFLRVSVGVFQVVRQDFEHWMDQGILAAPTRFEISDLFKNFVKDGSQ